MTRAVVAFIAIAYVLAVVLSAVVWMTGGHQSPLAGVGVLVMFAPTVAALVAKATMREGVRVAWTRFPVAFLPAALLLIPLTLHAAMLAVMASVGPLPWAEWLTPRADGLYYAPDSRGWGVLTAQALGARVVANAVVGLVVVSVLALFEEIGWRGWLLPRLVGHLGSRRAIAATAIIWGLWHVPLGLSGIQHIDGVSSVEVALGVPIGTVAAGLVIGWLWIRTESIWIVAIAHGALNNWGQYAFKYMDDFTTPDQRVVLAVGYLALYCLGAILLTFGLPSSRPVPPLVSARQDSQ